MSLEAKNTAELSVSIGRGRLIRSLPLSVLTLSYQNVKSWIEPEIKLADTCGLSGPDLQTARRLIENMKMKSETLGTNTSEVEVTQISKHGIWLLLKGNEHFLSSENFPWLKDAPISAIHNVELLNEHHLYWSDLDIDLLIKSVEDPSQFPLIAKQRRLPKS